MEIFCAAWVSPTECVGIFRCITPRCELAGSRMCCCLSSWRAWGWAQWLCGGDPQEQELEVLTASLAHNSFSALQVLQGTGRILIWENRQDINKYWGSDLPVHLRNPQESPQLQFKALNYRRHSWVIPWEPSKDIFPFPPWTRNETNTWSAESEENNSMDHFPRVPFKTPYIFQ